jgi:hypothetical protein
MNIQQKNYFIDQNAQNQNLLFQRVVDCVARFSQTVFQAQNYPQITLDIQNILLNMRTAYSMENDGDFGDAFLIDLLNQERFSGLIQVLTAASSAKGPLGLSALQLLKSLRQYYPERMSDEQRLVSLIIECGSDNQEIHQEAQIFVVKHKLLHSLIRKIDTCELASRWLFEFLQKDYIETSPLELIDNFALIARRSQDMKGIVQRQLNAMFGSLDALDELNMSNTEKLLACAIMLEHLSIPNQKLAGEQILELLDEQVIQENEKKIILEILIKASRGAVNFKARIRYMDYLPADQKRNDARLALIKAIGESLDVSFEDRNEALFDCFEGVDEDSKNVIVEQILSLVKADRTGFSVDEKNSILERLMGFGGPIFKMDILEARLELAPRDLCHELAKQIWDIYLANGDDLSAYKRNAIIQIVLRHASSSTLVDALCQWASIDERVFREQGSQRLWSIFQEIQPHLTSARQAKILEMLMFNSQEAIRVDVLIKYIPMISLDIQGDYVRQLLDLVAVDMMLVFSHKQRLDALTSILQFGDAESKNRAMALLREMICENNASVNDVARAYLLMIGHLRSTGADCSNDIHDVYAYLLRQNGLTESNAIQLANEVYLFLLERRRLQNVSNRQVLQWLSETPYFQKLNAECKLLVYSHELNTLGFGDREVLCYKITQMAECFGNEGMFIRAVDNALLEEFLLRTAQTMQNIIDISGLEHRHLDTTERLNWVRFGGRTGIEVYRGMMNKRNAAVRLSLQNLPMNDQLVLDINPIFLSTPAQRINRPRVTRDQFRVLKESLVNCFNANRALCLPLLAPELQQGDLNAKLQTIVDNAEIKEWFDCIETNSPSPTADQLALVVHHILEADNQARADELSDQMQLVIQFFNTIHSCPSGKMGGIAMTSQMFGLQDRNASASYISLRCAMPDAFASRFDRIIELAGYPEDLDEKRGALASLNKITSLATRIITPLRKQMGAILGADKPFCRNFLRLPNEVAVVEPTHQQRYLDGVLGKTFGFASADEVPGVDLNGEAVHPTLKEASAQDIVNAFLRYCPTTQEIIVQTKAILNAGFDELFNEWVELLPGVDTEGPCFVLDEDETPVAFSDLGVATILMNLGVLKNVR